MIGGKLGHEWKNYTWKCESSGHPDNRRRVDGKRIACARNDVEISTRKTKKCGCLVMLYCVVNVNGGWEVKKVILTHENHNPTPGKTRYISKFRQEEVNGSVRRKLFNDTNAGAKISTIHSSLANERNGFDNMSMTERDLRNIVAKERRLKFVDGDTNAMLSYFQKMTKDSQHFFHMHCLDDVGQLKDVLWVDARSRAAYEYFGDVVCFDATYLTNYYDLPFANFVGLNHHGQSILLGCALVSHEDAETYAWVFRTWLMCMGGKAPTCFLTDQDAAMRKALANVMGGTWHRWCLWHILSKFGKKLGKYKDYQDFKEVLQEAIYESISEAEFEERWCDAIDKYELGDDEWLAGMYRERRMWAPPFMRHLFWAGMKTTQRSESINSFFDGFVHKRTKLHQFVEQYCKAMEVRANSERVADANSNRYVRRLVTNFRAEYVFQEIYTDAKFKEVQEECLKMLYVQWQGKRDVNERIEEHTFGDRVWVVCKSTKKEVPLFKRRSYKVKIDMSTMEAWSECKLFECNGIMCRHLINLYDCLNVKEIPKLYVLDRWRKDIIRTHTMVKVAYHDPSKTEEVMCYDKMMVLFDPICLKAAHYGDMVTVVETLQNLEQILDERHSKKGVENDKGPTACTPSSVGNNMTPGGNNLTNVATPMSVTKPPPKRNNSYVGLEHGEGSHAGGFVGVTDPPLKARKGPCSVRFPSCIEQPRKKEKRVEGEVGPNKKNAKGCKATGATKQKKGNKVASNGDVEVHNLGTTYCEGGVEIGGLNIWPDLVGQI